MWCVSFRLFVLTIPGWGPTLFSMRGSGRTGRIQLSGFTASTNADSQAHHLLVQCAVPWFFMGHCGLSGKRQAGGGGDCISWSGYRWGGKSASIALIVGRVSWPSIIF